MRFIALDFESGGTDPRIHAPVTLGVAHMDGLDVLDGNEWVFARMDGPERKSIARRGYELRALEISGVTLAKLRNEGKPERVIFTEFSEWVKKCQGSTLPIVSFNATFDASFYSEWQFLCGAWDNHLGEYKLPPEPLAGPWECARRLWRSQFPNAKSDLDTAAAFFDLTRTGGIHGAAEDAILAGRVFTRLQDLAEAKAAA